MKILNFIIVVVVVYGEMIHVITVIRRVLRGRIISNVILLENYKN